MGERRYPGPKTIVMGDNKVTFSENESAWGNLDG
jgi:hypothetical protein